MVLMDNDKQDKKRGPFGLIFRIVLFLSIFLFIIFSVMTMLGGQSDALKKGAEDFLQATFGGPAQIKNFKGLTFFPNMGFDAEGVIVQKNAEDETVALTIEKAHVSIGFFDAMFQTGKLKALNIQNLNAVQGAVFAKRLYIDQLAIVSSKENAYRLTGKGEVGDKSFGVDIPMELSGSAYKFPKERELKAHLGDISMQGVWKDGFSNQLNSFVIKNADGHKLEANLVFSGFFGMNVSGELLLQDQLVVKPEIFIKDKGEGISSIQGKILIPEITSNDLELIGQSIDIIDNISAMFSSGKYDPDRIEFKDDVDVSIRMPSILSDQKKIGDIVIKIHMKDGRLSLEPEGSFGGGSINGDVRLNAEPDIASLSVDLQLKDAYLSELMTLEKKSGAFNFVLKLNGQGKGQDALKSNLSGDLNIVASEGEFDASLINLWGGGLVNALIPSFDAKDKFKLNCAIIHADIEKGLATLNPFFVDTARVTLNGTGTYNIVENSLDVKLKPEPKDVSLGDISAGVVLSGPIESPNANVSKLDLGKKIGGLLLGAVNPAFYVATFADLGLKDDHPCHSYLKGE